MLRRVMRLLAALILIVFTVFLINQTAQIVALADRLHPTVGAATFWGLMFLYAFCVFVPIMLLVRMPKPLVPPASENSEEFQEYLRLLSKRLKSNPLLKDMPVSSRTELEAALKLL